MNITIGCDPEIFLTKGTEFFSAFGLCSGTKEKPEPVPCGAIQVDGMAMEFNTDPTNDVEQFCTNISTVLECIRSRVKEHDAELELSPRASFRLPLEFLQAQPEKAVEMGCDPDYNAYTGELNSTPDGNIPMRTAGGHVHIGFGEDLHGHILECVRLTKLCDLMLGVPFVLLDSDDQRRNLYGKAGAMRPKPYGVEYRTLSNFWVMYESTRRFVFEQAYRVPSLYHEYENMLQALGITEDDVQNCINSSDKDMAERIVQGLGIQLPQV